MILLATCNQLLGSYGSTFLLNCYTYTYISDIIIYMYRERERYIPGFIIPAGNITSGSYDNSYFDRPSYASTIIYIIGLLVICTIYTMLLPRYTIEKYTGVVVYIIMDPGDPTLGHFILIGERIDVY